ncbi:hypothetical protein [Microbacterium sp. XT11]|uniref:hypothetical protein n=1 Tax=Microbacterium sp. XT11 TaxID=367477 RepID=UPI000830C8DD|nr:hypothetical protein [Microbacterium sp. XT11]
MSVRKQIAAEFETAWRDVPALAGLRVIATERALDDIREPTALIRAKSYDITPEAPNSHRNVGLLLTVISHFTDLERAGDALDDLVPAVLDYLDTRYQHDKADAVAYNDRLAYDIPFTVIASKE